MATTGSPRQFNTFLKQSERAGKIIYYGHLIIFLQLHELLADEGFHQKAIKELREDISISGKDHSAACHRYQEMNSTGGLIFQIGLRTDAAEANHGRGLRPTQISESRQTLFGSPLPLMPPPPRPRFPANTEAELAIVLGTQEC